MRTLTIDVSEETAARIEELARQRAISVAELVRGSVEEAIERDAEFEAATARVLAKNAELYERLS